MNDRGRGERVHMHATKDMNVHVANNKTEKVANNATSNIGCNHDVTIGANDTLPNMGVTVKWSPAAT